MRQDAIDLLAEENGWKVPDAQLQALRHSTNLRCALRNSRLRRLIGSVDSASDREAAYIKAQGQDPHFAKFLDETLKLLKPGI